MDHERFGQGISEFVSEPREATSRVLGVTPGPLRFLLPRYTERSSGNSCVAETASLASGKNLHELTSKSSPMAIGGEHASVIDTAGDLSKRSESSICPTEWISGVTQPVSVDESRRSLGAVILHSFVGHREVSMWAALSGVSELRKTLDHGYCRGFPTLLASPGYDTIHFSSLGRTINSGTVRERRK